MCVFGWESVSGVFEQKDSEIYCERCVLCVLKRVHSMKSFSRMSYFVHVTKYTYVCIHGWQTINNSTSKSCSAFLFFFSATIYVEEYNEMFKSFFFVRSTCTQTKTQIKLIINVQYIHIFVVVEMVQKTHKAWVFLDVFLCKIIRRAADKILCCCEYYLENKNNEKTTQR